MQTNFSIAQLADPNVAEAEAILRNCVHCGFCTATCPTYVTLGNELDSPRGRIYLIKDMLENHRPADAQITRHIDRCLSCLSCMTTCPSGVHYMHLVDHARHHIEQTAKRPLLDRITRSMLANILPYRQRFAAAARLAVLAKPFTGILAKFKPLKPLAAMVKLAPSRLAGKNRFTGHGQFPAQDNPVGKRVAVLTGCAQPVLDASINQATIELLTRLGVDVVLPKDEACCGSLVYHMGKQDQAHALARHMVDVWTREMNGEGLDGIIITTSGCGTTIKDYGHMLQHDPQYADKAKRVADIAMDVTEFLQTLDPPQLEGEGKPVVTYHSACSLQHGQKIKNAPKDLLKRAGFEVRESLEPHLCCGSAGTYNILQSEISDQLKSRKLANLEKTRPDVIAAGNIGCLTQIGSGTEIPVVHTVHLLNWAYGGAKPQQLSGR